MKVSTKWIAWAHGPGSEDGQPLAIKLCELADAAGHRALELVDAELIQEVVSVAELYRRPAWGDALYDRGLWWRSQPSKVISEGRAALWQLKAQGEATPG